MIGSRVAALAVGVVSLASLAGHGPPASGPADTGPSVAGTSVTREGVPSTSTTPATTPTTTAPTPAPTAPPTTAEQVRGREAAGLLSFGLDDLAAYSPGWTVAFLPARAGFRGLTLPDQRRTEIYVRLGDTVRRLSHTVAHEIGHVIDVTASTEATRQAYLAIRGLAPDQAWFGCDRCNDFATPAGDFAETVGLALSGPQYRWKSTLGPAPTLEQIAAVRALYHW